LRQIGVKFYLTNSLNKNLKKCQIKLRVLHNQWLIAIPTPEATNDAVSEQISTNLYITPFFPQIEEKNYYLIPSVGMMNHILHIINPEFQLQMLPILGNITEKTLLDLHKKGKHPIALYSNWVLSNPPEVHGNRCGPLPILLHDITHIFLATNCLSLNQFNFLFAEIIPAIESIIENNPDNPIMKNAYQELIYTFSDMNFSVTSRQNSILKSGLLILIDRAHSLYYLEKQKSNQSLITAPFGNIADEMLLQFYIKMYQLKKVACETYQVNIGKIINWMHMSEDSNWAGYFRAYCITKFLQYLAKAYITEKNENSAVINVLSKDNFQHQHQRLYCKIRELNTSANASFFLSQQLNC